MKSCVLVPGLGSVVLVPGGLAPLKKPLECLLKLLQLLIFDVSLVTPESLMNSRHRSSREGE